MILAYHCSCSYREDMTDDTILVRSSNKPLTVTDNDILVDVSYREDMSLIVKNDDNWNHYRDLWDCDGSRVERTEMKCPDGYYISGVRNAHKTGNDQGRNLKFQIICTNAIGFDDRETSSFSFSFPSW